MIIVIGKKDKENIKDAVAYIQQCSSFFLRDGNAERLVADCKRIANRLLGAINYKDKS